MKTLCLLLVTLCTTLAWSGDVVTRYDKFKDHTEITLKGDGARVMTKYAGPTVHVRPVYYCSGTDATCSPEMVTFIIRVDTGDVSHSGWWFYANHEVIFFSDGQRIPALDTAWEYHGVREYVLATIELADSLKIVNGKDVVEISVGGYVLKLKPPTVEKLRQLPAFQKKEKP